jgi:hypothetical protein
MNRTLQTLTKDLPGPSRNPALAPDGSLIAVESGGGIVLLGEQGPLQEFGVPGLRSSYPAWGAGNTTIAVSATADPIANYN